MQLGQSFLPILQAMVDAVVAVALQKLTDVVEQNARILSGVAHQVEEISAELKRVQLFLNDAGSGSANHRHQSVRHWLREIRLLAYKIEDIVETFAVESSSKNRRRNGFKLKRILARFACLACEAKSLRNLGLEIEKAKADVSRITSTMQRYDVRAIGAAGESLGNEQQWWIRQTYAHQIEEHFVGMEEDRLNLLSLVLDDDDTRFRVISIWGMGGLGKTTLARKIYKDREIQRCFARFAWVCITQNAQIKVILQDILTQLAPERMKEVNCMGSRELIQQIYEVQKTSKCLVVLDDIWRLEDWKSLVAAFPILEGESKILITTRMKKIAEIGFPYSLRCLTEKESWELLKRITSFGKDVSNFKIEQKLEYVGLEMVHKCGGLPLAISVLGGILKDKNSQADWQMVNRYLSSYLTEVKDDEEEGGAVAQVLCLSYDDLPYYLKPCFLYLGSFREDEEIVLAELYMQWEAEGMILSQHQRSDESLDEVAERYFVELARRSMVQLRFHEFLAEKKYQAFILHDMMRDLCLEKGREEEFCKVIDFRGEGSSSTNSFSCRLVINMDSEIPNLTAKISGGVEEHCQHLRSLSCINLDSKFCGMEMKWPEGLINFDRSSRSLRVAQFEGFIFKGKKLPVDLGRLIHLRYLYIENCQLDELPSSVAELPFLHTLHLQVNNRIKVPNVLCKMKRLKNLRLFCNDRYTNNRGRLRLHGLNELELLSGIDSRTDEVSDIVDLPNLQIVMARLFDYNSLRVMIDYVDKKAHKLKLIALRIEGSDFATLDKGHVLLTRIFLCHKLNHLSLLVKMNKFPRYEPNVLQNLEALSLQGNHIEEDPIETLERLPKLRFLLLEPESYVGKDMTFHAWGFPQLRRLRLFKLPNLQSWRVENGSMPNLCSLVIMSCPKIEMVPDGLKFITSLRRMEVYDMPDKFCNRLKKCGNGEEGDDYHKVQHVASISINRPPQLLSHFRRSGFLKYLYEPL